MYDFDEIIERRGTNCAKWDTMPAPDVLPMWVADMDFRTAPAIIDALERRVRHGVYGYARVPGEWYDALGGWFARRHGWPVERGHVLTASGVVPALSAIIKALTVPGDSVIIQTPAYNCFFSSIRNNGCVASESPLVYRDGTYSMDFDDLEARAADPAAKVMLLCSPHNPVGRVWSREELTRVGDICLRNSVVVIADEIHCDLIAPGHTHIPFATLGAGFERGSVTCVAPSKTFNLAGVQVAAIVASDDSLRRRIYRALNDNETGELNVFAVEALIAACNEGAEWLDELRDYLHENYLTLRRFFETRLPRLRVLPLEGTYLVWVDCKALGISSAVIAKTLLDEGRIKVNPGTLYGAAGGGFVRINIATRRADLIRALEAIGNIYGQ
ncbi:MAG: pyridoxal phosphate-dependent aminotransferase [Alistipes sp.]|jgi:cystathionine beta-lyase|nr:pyridoxal phosphate-dependent aminotransferase [Alistipes sp.]